MSNPLAYNQTRLGNYGWDHNIVGNAFLEIEPIENLKFRSSLGTKLAFYGSESYTPLYWLSPANTNSKTNFYREMNMTLITTGRIPLAILKVLVNTMLMQSLVRVIIWTTITVV